jgi:hypothetical protein
MAKFIADISFTAHLEIEADDIEAAKAEAEAIARERSVYKDDWVDEITEKCYQDGAEGNDFELQRVRGYEFRDKNFEADDVIVIVPELEE